MPKYSFECSNQDCGLKFDRILKMGDYVVYPCPACSMAAPRVISGGFAFSFEVSSTKEGNSGVHKEDYPTADHAVGRDAERRWGVMRERDQVKAKIRAESGINALIRKDVPNGTEYVPMTPQQQKGHRAVAREASRVIARAKEEG